MPIEPLLHHVTPLMLVICRLAGLFVFTPLLSNASLPRQLRALLAVFLGVAVYAGLPPATRIAPATDLFQLLPLIVGETLIGVVMGFIASLPNLALNLSGFFMGHQMGLTLSQVYNPEIGADTDTLGQLLMYVGVATFLAVGGLETVYLALVSTFTNVPIGGFAFSQTPVHLIAGVISSGFELAIRVAAPVLAIVFLLLIALGFVMKTMPQINVMSVGFTIKILFGLSMLAISIAAAQSAVGDEIQRVMQLVVGWARSLA